MQLDTLLKQLVWLRRGWLIAAVITGVLYALLIPFYLYTAWVQYVVVATGAAAYTGVNGGLVRLMAAWAGLIDASIIVFQVIGLAFWFGWLWFSARFAVILSPQGKLRFGAASLVIVWFIPVLNLLFVPLALMDIARTTMHDPQQEAPEAEATPDMPWLAWIIGLLDLVGDGLFFILAHRPPDAFDNPVSGQTLMHLAAASGVVTLMLLLAMDAYIRRLTEAQETRLARIHLH
jgi:Domain of unknown function (DUF4328)